MSSVESQIQPPAIPVSRDHESPDIIDIDALDADEIVYIGSAPPSQRRRVGEYGRAVPVIREVIDVTDSEDDNEIQFIGHNPARPRPPLVRRQRVFSPPPPPQIGGIPPVPQIPERFLAVRQRQPPGPVLPNEDPLPFEAELRPSTPDQQPPPLAAASSRHVPFMGFGGALLAGVRRIIGPRDTSLRRDHRNGWGVPDSFIVRWSAFDFADEEEDAFDGLDEIGYMSEEDNPLATHRVRIQLERAFKQRDSTHSEPDYRPEYTHPNQPSPGFTHDFSLSSSTPLTEEDPKSTAHFASGSGTRLCEVTLICAACRDPLVVGASDVGEDRAKRKLWGLRCGHLLDGKCIEKFMEPVPLPSEAAESCSGRMTIEKGEQTPPNSDNVVADSAAGSMRSRLRPRRVVPLPSSPHSAPVSPSSGRRGSQTTHRSNRKGKGKMKAPGPEAEHEWSCPVSGCGRVHLSLLVDGRWTMDEKRGAITVFV